MSTEAKSPRKRINVLIFPAAGENALEVYRAIRHSLHINVLAASSRDDVSSLVYERAVLKLPEMWEPTFLDRLNELILEHQVDVVFPTHDSAALFLAENARSIAAKIPNADPWTNLTCRHKRRTYEVFRDDAFCPNVYDHPDKKVTFPAFAKPDLGQGSVGVRILRDNNELESVRRDPDMVVTEYLPGAEYTVECFTDRHGQLIFVGSRERVEVRMGISFRSREAVVTPEVRAIADRINEKLRFRGMWWFQAKTASCGGLKLLEVSTRPPGTGGFFRHKGVNLPLLTVFDLLERPVEIRPGTFEIELFRSTNNFYRYSFEFKHVYVDLDDTLILNDRLNADLIRFLYIASSRGKRLVLITKSEVDPRIVLRAHRVDPSLFDEVIHLEASALKSNHIEHKDSIFIDNWYVERKEVADATGIPVFDVDAVEGLVHAL